MIVKESSDVQETKVEEEEVSEVFRQILIGPEDGSNNIVMRRFKIMSGGHTPHHQHPFEHVVLVESGRGWIISPKGEKIDISAGKCLFVPGGEIHQFQNPHEEPLQFLCIILNQAGPIR